MCYRGGRGKVNMQYTLAVKTLEAVFLAEIGNSFKIRRIGLTFYGSGRLIHSRSEIDGY